MLRYIYIIVRRSTHTKIIIRAREFEILEYDKFQIISMSSKLTINITEIKINKI